MYMLINERFLIFSLGQDTIQCSPLLSQRGLDLTHSHQRAQLFQLHTDLGHVHAAHAVDLLT